MNTTFNTNSIYSTCSAYNSIKISVIVLSRTAKTITVARLSDCKAVTRRIRMVDGHECFFLNNILAYFPSDMVNLKGERRGHLR